MGSHGSSCQILVAFFLRSFASFFPGFPKAGAPKTRCGRGQDSPSTVRTKNRDVPNIPQARCMTSPRIPQNRRPRLPPRTWPVSFERRESSYQRSPSQLPKNAPMIWPRCPKDFANLPKDSPKALPRMPPAFGRDPPRILQIFLRTPQGPFQDPPVRLHDFPKDSPRLPSQNAPGDWVKIPRQFA